MHKIDKFLSKLNRKNRDSIEFLIKKVLERKFYNLDNKKLKGFKDIFSAAPSFSSHIPERHQ